MKPHPNYIPTVHRGTSHNPNADERAAIQSAAKCAPGDLEYNARTHSLFYRPAGYSDHFPQVIRKMGYALIPIKDFKWLVCKASLRGVFELAAKAADEQSRKLKERAESRSDSSQYTLHRTMLSPAQLNAAADAAREKAEMYRQRIAAMHDQNQLYSHQYPKDPLDFPRKNRATPCIA